MHLSETQKQLCSLLQTGLPICERPFAEMAGRLNTTEKDVLKKTVELKNSGIIRRIGPVINYRRLGHAGTLAAAHVQSDILSQVVEAVNSLDSVSHNYLRRHYYNLWFTVQHRSYKDIETLLSNLSARFGIDFHSLPAKRIFKLNVRFDTDSETESSSDIEPFAEHGIAELDESEKLILSKLQHDLKIVGRPFARLSGDSVEPQDVIRIIRKLISKSVIRRIGGIVNHYELGFTANVLFVAAVGDDDIVSAGAALARFRIVSHCCERRTLPKWPYNLFAMMHARSMGTIQRSIDKFVKTCRIKSFELLPTEAELKKQPVRRRFE